MALSPNDCKVPEIPENEGIIVELLEEDIDRRLARGLRCFDVTQERKNLFDVTLRQKYQGAGWYLNYRAFGVAGWHIIFAVCGPEDKENVLPLTGRIGRPAIDFMPTVTKAGEVGPVHVDGSAQEYAQLPPHPSRMVTHPASTDDKPTDQDAPRKESKRGNG